MNWIHRTKMTVSILRTFTSQPHDWVFLRFMQAIRSWNAGEWFRSNLKSQVTKTKFKVTFSRIKNIYSTGTHYAPSSVVWNQIWERDTRPIFRMLCSLTYSILGTVRPNFPLPLEVWKWWWNIRCVPSTTVNESSDPQEIFYSRSFQVTT